MSSDIILTADRIIALNNGLKDAEKHLNEIQSHYRLLASAWMMGAIGASGLLLFPSEGQSAVRPFLPGLLCLSSSLGTAILWLSDRTYQRLIGAHFNEGLALEAAFAWLPQVRHRIRAEFKGTLPRRVFVFYLGIASFLWAVGTAMVVIDLQADPSLALLTASMLVAVLVAAIVVAKRAESVALNLGGSPLTAAPRHADRVEAFCTAAAGQRKSPVSEASG